MLAELSDIDALSTIKNGDIPADIKNSNKKVGIILTQSWCPEWIAMKGYFKKLTSENTDIDIFVLAYDKKSYFEDFMKTKETVWENYMVPFILYYKNGELVSESNFISYKDFIDSFNENINL